MSGLKQEMQAFDRLTHLYQNPAGSSQAVVNKISGKEKMKRVRSMQEFKESCQVAFKRYETMIESKQTKGTTINGADLED